MSFTVCHLRLADRRMRCTAIFSVAEESGEPGLGEPQADECPPKDCTAIFSVSEPVMLGRCMLLFAGVGICDFVLGLSRSLRSTAPKSIQQRAMSDCPPKPSEGLQSLQAKSKYG